MQQQNRIIKLPKDVADKIAAGEVVDRPLSVVKELVENAIDAGADSLVIEIKNGGKSYMRVTDNGCGISKTDLSKAFERHATSKIRTAVDLDSIGTLGFRGEALASIAAVSEVEVITKTAEEAVGSRLVLSGGELISETDTGCPEGTTILVSNLFFNTPARLKFLKSDGTESSLILDFLSKMAIAYSSIRFRVINNGSIIFSTAGKGNVHSSILTVYSRELGDPLLHIEGSEGVYSLDAYMSPPAYTRTTRKQQIYFVNGRYIKSKLLEDAVEEAYRQRLPEGRHPVAILFLRVSPEHLDVNIHPNKREIRFDDNSAAQSFLVSTISKGLSVNEAVPEITEKSPFRSKNMLAMPEIKICSNLVSEDNTSTITEVNVNDLLSTRRAEVSAIVSDSKQTDFSYLNKNEEISIEKPKNKFDFSDITITGSIFGTYITGTDEDTFYLFDQHAAHERVFYESLLAASQNEEKTSQLLIAPVVKESTAAICANPELFVTALTQIGFDLEVFGTKALVVKAVPAFMNQSEAFEFLDAFFDQADDLSVFRDQKKLARIIMNACKNAVKGNQKLSIDEMKHLVADLSETENPFSCPHGRPTFIKLTRTELEKLFKRV